MDKKLVIIAGPTGIGKTALTIELATRFGTEIISADSRQVYKEMTIGTAVPSSEELEAVKHHFVQVKSIDEYYNASMYEFDVLDLLEQLFEKYDMVFMTGGSGLYIDAVCKGIDDIPTVEQGIRKKMLDYYHQHGLQGLQEKLKELDPRHYREVDLNNHKRLLKALEISVMTGKPYSSFLTKTDKKRDFDIVKICLDMEREKLYDRINQRVDKMVKSGLVEEAGELFPYRDKNPLNTVGYKELFAHFEGKLELEEAIEKIKNNTRKYARKQLTWFRKDKDAAWFHPGDKERIEKRILSL